MMQKQQLIMNHKALACQRAGSWGVHPAYASRPRRAFLATPVRVQSSANGPAPTSAGSIYRGASLPDDPASTCPFLATLQSLPAPPLVKVPWHQRFKQLFSPQEFQQQIMSSAGDAQVVQVAQQIGFANFVMPRSPDLAKEVFAGETSGTTQQADVSSFVQLMGEKCLVLAEESRHKHLRALLQPAFSREAVHSYLPTIQALVHRHLTSWEEKGAKGLKAYNGLKLMTFDFIISLTFGREYSQDEILALSQQYQKCTGGFLAWPWLDIPFTPFARAMRAREAMIAQFQQAVEEARQKLAAGQHVPGIIGSLVSAVDEKGNRLSDQEITDNILLLLMAGQDTSSTSLTQILSNLQDHPAVWQKLRQEQAAVVAGHGPDITAAALMDMRYADAVIRESLRRNPVVAQLFRVAARDFDLGGYQVPKSSPLLVPLDYIAAHDERWLGQQGELDPGVFNPNRMLTEEGSKPGAQLPFGYGPRYCLGAALAMAEMKVFLATLARSYDFTADNKTKWVQAVGQIPKNGLPIVITRHT